ncbi:MAG: radical SAM protein [Lentisphaerae bacterium]|jgi:hypothetical protein|nr:radical SAM protein [Lentisphaerota bacterium]MBT4814926.1 radical SAM protein [Lentisphaerota bacterium]MBT5605822.1 radical SAM protein [Lentisphaerota bacterium]MBT7055625.1 radical SAM protein [Lentisphaerota bacterium]MBT7846675.1 radical SAM protein [Lentisphaerota bacterium]
MAHILLTDHCNRRCPYCFAKDRLADEKPTNMAYDDFVIAVNFLVRSGERGITLLGGEPTLHPELVRLYSYLIRRRLSVLMFTNGCADTRVVKELQRCLQPEQTHFVVNVNAPGDREPWEERRQEEFFTALGDVCGLGLNLYRPDLDLAFSFDYFDRYELRPDVRIGIAHPLVGHDNVHLPVQDFSRANAMVAEFVRECDRRDILVTLDCGFTLCDFSDADLGAIARARTRFEIACGPIVDIGPDLLCWPCFPLSELERVPLSQFADLEEIKEHFGRIVGEKLQACGHTGLYSECADCRYQERDRCSGGCLAHAFAGD